MDRDAVDYEALTKTAAERGKADAVILSKLGLSVDLIRTMMNMAGAAMTPIFREAYWKAASEAIKDKNFDTIS